jgi:hypothetical protein
LRGKAVRLVFRGVPELVAAHGLSTPEDAVETLELEVVPELSPRDRVIFLLHTAAEIEHSLMVQYLYAAWSLPPDGPPGAQRWRRDILQVAREEMAHFTAVQNLLRFVGGPLNFDREDFPFRTDLYPFPFRLEPLSRRTLARYVAAEMPADAAVDPRLLAEVAQLAGSFGTGPVNRVGILYATLGELFADTGQLPDSAFRSDTASTAQAVPARFRSDVGHGPLFLRTVRDRGAALSLLDDIAGQGEGDRDVPDSHFLTFVEMFDAWPGDAAPLDVPSQPNTSTPPDDGSDDPATAAGRITHPRARAWGEVFNHHYRMLLSWLQHALLTDTRSAASSGLALRAFATMFALSDVGQLLTTLPRTPAGDGRAGAPFELPYTLALPDLVADRWAQQRDLIVTARDHLTDLGEAFSPAEEQVLRRLLTSLAEAADFVAIYAESPE